MKQGVLNQVVKGITDGLRATPATSRAVQEKNFESREDFEAEARRCRAVIIYSTEPVELPHIPGGPVMIQLPEVDELPGANE